MMKLVLGISIPYIILYIYFGFYLSILNPRWPPQQDKVKQRTIFSQKLQTLFNPNCTLIIIGMLIQLLFMYILCAINFVVSEKKHYIHSHRIPC
jgi:uncharacterized membrane protein (DUF106 family)